VNQFGQPIHIKNADGEIIGERIPQVSRLTKNELSGGFGPDNGRALVVSLRAGDIIAFRPQGTRREVTATAKDIYVAVLRWQANRLNLAKAIEAKARKKAKREREAIARAERKLRRTIAGRCG